MSSTERISTAVQQFLNEDRNAVLATTKRDGAAQLTPVWYLFEDGRIYVSAMASTAKVHNLRRNPTGSLCIDGGRGDARYVVVYGKVALVEPDEPLQAQTRRRIIRHYHNSDEEAEAYYDTVKGNPAALIVLTPEKVVSQGF